LLCTAAGVQQHEESNSTNLPDFLSEDYVLANVLNDITNYEAHQNSVPVWRLFIRFPGFSIATITPEDHA
jgi:hypothetical protein